MSDLKQSLLLLLSLPIVAPLLPVSLVSFTPNQTTMATNTLPIVVPLLSILLVSFISIQTTLATTTEIFGVKIEKNPPQSELDKLGVFDWTTWEAGPGTIIPWTYQAKETMYSVKGKVKITVEGYDGSIEFVTGDLAVVPKGTKTTWEVIEAAKKYYQVEK